MVLNPVPEHENIRGADYYAEKGGPMLTQATVEKMHAMKMHAMAEALEHQIASHGLRALSLSRSESG